MVELIVKAGDQRTIRKMNELGFHGLTATGANHPKHHQMIATGHVEY